jgi:hypothetical protein
MPENHHEETQSRGAGVGAQLARNGGLSERLSGKAV